MCSSSLIKCMRRVLLLSDDESYLAETGRDLHTKSGVIKANKIKIGKVVRTHLGKEFLAVKPTIRDVLRKAERGAQVILPKDVAMILGYTGISADSVIVDAGSGSGYAAIFLANYVPNGKVVTYENDKRFVKIVQKNVKASESSNIKVKRADVTRGIKERNVDLVLLDLQNADKVVKHAYNSLKGGGYLVVYSPTVDHLVKSLKAVRKRFIGIETVENIVREWQTERTVRPKTMGLMHTGFLTFARKGLK